MAKQHKVKEAPHSKESEQMVLGCMLTSIDSLNIAADALDEIDFYYIEHQVLFQTLKSAYKQDKPADVHLICEELKRAGKLDAIGGAAYVTTLAQYAGTSAYIEEYADIVKSKATLRKLIKAADIIKKSALEEPHNVHRVFDDAKKLLSNIEQTVSSNEITTIGNVLSGEKSRIAPSPVVDRLEQKYMYFQEQGKSIVTGLPTGFTDIDNQTTLLEDSNLIIVAARPAMGKTAFALNIADNLSINQSYPIGIISLEMNADQLVDRFLSMRTGIPGESLKRGTFDSEQLKMLKHEAEKMKDVPLFFHDQGCHTISQVTAKARRLKESYGIRLLIVDYLQLLGTNKQADSRQYEVAEVSRGLKLLAMELQIPIICISQLSRKVEERGDKRPLLSDLRDSGQVEQDADVVLFIHRKDYYDPNDKPGQADVYTAKNRNGAAFKGSLQFNRDTGKFSLLSPLVNPEHQDEHATKITQLVNNSRNQPGKISKNHTPDTYVHDLLNGKK